MAAMASPSIISSHSRSSASVVGRAGSSLSVSASQKRRGSAARCLTLNIRAETMTTEKLGIKVERDPPESKLTELGVRQWPKFSLLSKPKQMGNSDGTVAYDFATISIYVKDHDGVTSELLQKLEL